MRNPASVQMPPRISEVHEFQGRVVVAVSTPYNERFIAAVRDLPYGQRVWDRVGQVWIVDASLKDTITDLVLHTFGSVTLAGAGADGADQVLSRDGSRLEQGRLL